MHKIALRISPKAFLRCQVYVVTVLLGLGLLYYLAKEMSLQRMLLAVAAIFDVGEETSVPTWFSSANIALSAILALLIGIRDKTTNKTLGLYWIALAVILLGMSVDEVAAIHERANNLPRVFGFAAPLDEGHQWLVYGTIITIVVALVFIPFVRKISKDTALLLVLAAAVFVSGALGLEFAGSVMIATGMAERGDFIYDLRRLLEEGAEMYGIAILNYCLLREHAPGRVALAVGVRGAYPGAAQSDVPHRGDDPVLAKPRDSATSGRRQGPLPTYGRPPSETAGRLRRGAR